MAQHDTGLGWSAKDDWLLSAAPATLGSIAVFSSSVLPSIPTGTTAADLVATDFWGWITDGYHNCAVVEPGTTAYCFFVGNQFVVCSDRQASVVQNGVRTGGWGYGRSWIYDQMWTYQNPDPATGLYYGLIAGIPTTNRNPAIPTYNTISEGLAEISYYLQTYNKLTAGYSVACVARWVTPEGTSLVSPVLISTLPEAVVITTDGTTPAAGFTSFDFLRDGRRFYMGIVTGLDPSATINTQLEDPDLSQFAAAAPSKVFSLLASASFSNILVSTAPDPYQEETEESTENGGGGEDIDDNPVDEETMPLPSVAGLGFCSVYVPSQSELIAMSTYLWNGSFDVSQVVKLFSNPMDSIIGLSAVPVDLAGTSEQIYLGGVALTGVTMPRYTGRTAVKVDMGTVTIEERYGAYLDYDPYTEFAIYVPFIGIKNLKADDIMGKTISLMYDIDILTGACVAYLRPAGGSVLYEWAGQCAQQIPITSSNWDNIFRNAMTAAATVGTSLFAPASAPVLAGAVASAAVQTVAAKPRVDRSGALTGVSGWLGQLRPYIIRTIPEAYIPADQNKFVGYPAYINVSLGDISGYNEVASIHLEGIPATGNELSEIESLLKGGVIF